MESFGHRPEAQAGAMGVPFLPARSMMGSRVADRLPALKTLDCPYTGERLALIPALNPDVALTYLQRFCYSSKSWEDYLEKIGVKSLLAASRAGSEVTHA